MKPSDLTPILAKCITTKQTVLIVGAPGIGKTDIVEAAAHAAGADLQLSHPAVSDPTDYKGMPCVVNIPAQKDSTYTTKAKTEARFLPFGDLQRLIDAKQPTVCFLDDIGQAPHGVQAALMQLILARRVNGHRISDHVVFMGATNDTSHRAGVHSILEPVKSRFSTILKLDVDLEDWCKWANGPGGMPAELVGFIRFRPDLLHQFTPTRELTNSPSPRTVANVGRWLANGICNVDVFAGAAGQGFALEFMGFLAVWRALPSIEGILANPHSAPVPGELAARWAVCAALARRFRRDTAGACLTYLARLPKEYQWCCIRDASTQAMGTKDDFSGTREFIAWATSPENKGIWGS